MKKVYMTIGAVLLSIILGMSGLLVADSISKQTETFKVETFNYEYKDKECIVNVYYRGNNGYDNVKKNYNSLSKDIKFCLMIPGILNTGKLFLVHTKSILNDSYELRYIEWTRLVLVINTLAK